MKSHVIRTQRQRREGQKVNVGKKIYGEAQVIKGSMLLT